MLFCAGDEASDAISPIRGAYFVSVIFKQVILFTHVTNKKLEIKEEMAEENTSASPPDCGVLNISERGRCGYHWREDVAIIGGQLARCSNEQSVLIK